MNTRGWAWRGLALVTGLSLLACGGDDTTRMTRSAERVLARSAGKRTDDDSSKLADTAAMMMSMSSSAMCALPPTPSTCERCIVDSCAETCEVCAADSHCAEALGCVAKCSNASCIDGCGSSATLDKVTALTGCVLDRCSRACSADADSRCDACAQDECSPALASCGRDADCVDVLNCCNGTDEACQACIDSAPARTKERLQEVVECLQGCGC